jgi:hypothetical protein
MQVRRKIGAWWGQLGAARRRLVLIGSALVSLVSILGTLAVSAERMANLVSVPDKFHEALPWTTYFDYDWVPAGRFGFIGDPKDPDAPLHVQVPDNWSDVQDQRVIHFGSTRNAVGPAILASRNGEEFVTSYGVPGLFLGASKSISGKSFREILKTKSTAAARGCDQRTWIQRDYFERPDYRIRYWMWDRCGGEEGQKFAVFAAKPKNGKNLVVVGQMQWAQGSGDYYAFEKVLDTFDVNMNKWPKRFT